MIFSYFDSKTKWEYMVDFSSDKVDKPGFMMTIVIQMECDDGSFLRVTIHHEPIAIKNGAAQWKEYHIRDSIPFTTLEFRNFVQKLINNKAFM